MTTKPRMEEDAAIKAAAQFLAQSGTDLIADTRARIAYLIRAELVCCDIYEKVAGPFDAMDEGHHSVAEHKASRIAFRERRRAARADGSWHHICYYGEWSARLALEGDLPTGEIYYGPWDMVAGKPAEPSESDRPKQEQEPS